MSIVSEPEAVIFSILKVTNVKTHVELKNCLRLHILVGYVPHTIRQKGQSTPTMFSEVFQVHKITTSVGMSVDSTVFFAVGTCTPNESQPL